MNYSIQKHDQQDPDHINVHWDTLTICQLKCSYCYARNEYGKEWGKISSKETIDGIIDALGRSSLNFNLGLLGGEPTLGPHYYYVLDKLAALDNNNNVYVVTNAEKDLSTHPHYDNLAFLFSYHPKDCTDRNRFLKNIRWALDAGYQCKVNIMLHPDKRLWDDIKAMYYTCKDIEGLKVHPHFMYGNSIQKLFNYRKEFWTYFDFLGVEMEKDLIYDDDKFNDFQVFDKKLTNFKGWSCFNNNYEIDVYGNVVQFCREKSDDVNLTRDRDFFKRIEETKAMICPHSACNCDGLLKQLKIKGNAIPIDDISV